MIPIPKQGNMTLDLNDCLIFTVSDFMGLLTRSFLMSSNRRSLLVIIPASTHFLVHLHLSKLPGTRIASFLLRNNTTKLKWAIHALTFPVLTHLESNRVSYEFWQNNFKYCSHTKSPIRLPKETSYRHRIMQALCTLLLTKNDKIANGLPRSYYSLRHGNVFC